MEEMNYKLPFEKYEIYHLVVVLAVDIYGLAKTWSSDERFGVISQIKRASTSVGANIAEGTSRSSEKEKARFIEIAFGSLMEVAHFLFMARKLSFIDDAVLNDKKLVIDKLANKINAFRKIFNGPNLPKKAVNRLRDLAIVRFSDCAIFAISH